MLVTFTLIDKLSGKTETDTSFPLGTFARCHLMDLFLFLNFYDEFFQFMMLLDDITVMTFAMHVFFKYRLKSIVI